MRRLGGILLWSLAAAAILLVATNRWGDPSLYPDRFGRPVEVYVVSHGYHSGLVVPREAVGRMARPGGPGARIGARFAAYDWVEIGWGEARFYRQVPTVGDLSVSLALSALFQPGNASVLHLVGISGAPRDMFPHSDLERLELSEAGFRKLVAGIEETFAPGDDGSPEELGPGLYGPSLFYGARGSFHVFSVCNHWTARLLSAAGVPTSPVLSTLPAGLLFDLRHRPAIRLGWLGLQT